MTGPSSTGDFGDGESIVSRRDVLKTGAIASGSLILGGTTAAGARRLGGSGFVSVEDFEEALDDDRTFKILGPDGWTLDHPAGCGGSGKRRTREYAGYLIRFAEGVDDDTSPPTLGRLYVRPDRHVQTGGWHDVTAARECPPDGTATNPAGNESEQSVLKVGFRPTDFGGRAGFRAGEPVTDGDDPDPDPAVVIAVFDVPTSDWIVFANETVASHNPGYDPEERVVVVAFEHLLDAGWADWRDADPDELFDGVVARGIKFHAFPQSRLDRRKGRGR